MLKKRLYEYNVYSLGMKILTLVMRSVIETPNISVARQVPIVPPTETLPPLSFPPALSGSNHDIPGTLRGFASDMSAGLGVQPPFATVSKRALSGSRKSLMASYAEALSRSTEALDEAYVSQPVSRRGSELVSFSFLTLCLCTTTFISFTGVRGSKNEFFFIHYVYVTYYIF